MKTVRIHFDVGVPDDAELDVEFGCDDEIAYAIGNIWNMHVTTVEPSKFVPNPD